MKHPADLRPEYLHTCLTAQAQTRALGLSPLTSPLPSARHVGVSGSLAALFALDLRRAAPKRGFDRIFEELSSVLVSAQLESTLLKWF